MENRIGNRWKVLVRVTVVVIYIMYFFLLLSDQECRRSRRMLYSTGIVIPTSHENNIIFKTWQHCEFSQTFFHLFHTLNIDPSSPIHTHTQPYPLCVCFSHKHTRRPAHELFTFISRSTQPLLVFGLILIYFCVCICTCLRIFYTRWWLFSCSLVVFFRPLSFNTTCPMVVCVRIDSDHDHVYLASAIATACVRWSVYGGVKETNL